MILSPQEREYLVDMYEWALDCKIQTFNLRTYQSTDPKLVGSGKPHRKYPVFKCIVHLWEGNKLIDKTFVENSVSALRHSMGKFMHERWDLERPEGDSIEQEADKKMEEIGGEPTVKDIFEEVEDCF